MCRSLVIQHYSARVLLAGRALCLCVIVCVWCNTVFAQVQPIKQNDQQSATSATAPQFKSLDDLALQSINGNKDFSGTNNTFSFTKTPMGAVWRSFVIPGWGQFYNEQYWKVPLALGGAGALLYQVIVAENLRANRNALYQIAEQPNSGYTRQQLERIALEREFYRDIRDTYSVYLAGVYLIIAMDAYVGAHLYDFDVSDNVKAGIGFSPMGRVYFNLRW
jgi:hypothetical protein